MKILLTLIITLSFVSISYADNFIGLENGFGVKIASYETNSYPHTSLRLAIGLSKYQFMESRLSFLDKAPYLSTAYGLTTTGRNRLWASFGLAYLTTIPKQELSGHEQFISSLGTSFDLNKDWILDFAIRHLSNGEGIFNHGRRPNGGIDTIFMGISRRF